MVRCSHNRSKNKKTVKERVAKKLCKSSILSNSTGGGMSSSNGSAATTVKEETWRRSSSSWKRSTRGCSIGVCGERRKREKFQPQPEVRKEEEEEQHLPSQKSVGSDELRELPELKLKQPKLKKEVEGASYLFVEPHFLWRGGKESAVRGGKAKTDECILRLIMESQRRVPHERARRCSSNAPSILKPVPAVLEDDLASKINSLATFKVKNGGLDGSLSPYRLQLPGAKRYLNPNKMRTALSLCSGIRGQDRGMAAALAQYQMRWYCVDIDPSGAATASAKAEGFLVFNQIPSDRREFLKLLGQKDRNVYFRVSMKEFQAAMDAHAPRSWSTLAPNAIIAGTPCQLYSMVNQELWYVSKKRGDSKGIGAWKPIPNEELDEFISIVFACRKYVDIVIHENVSGFLKGRPHVLVPTDQELEDVNMAFRNIESQRKRDSSTALMNVIATRPLHWLLYAMVCRMDMSIQSFLLTASALGAPEHKANVLTICVRRGLWLPRLPIAQHHVVRPFSGGGTHGLAIRTVISAGADAPPATSIFENLDNLLATHEGTWSAYAKLSVFHRYSRFVWFSRGLRTDAFELEIKCLVSAGFLETSISEWGVVYAKEFADDLSIPGTHKRKRRIRAYHRSFNPHRSMVRNLFTLACRNAEKQWRISIALSASGGQKGSENGGGSNIHGHQLNWTNTKWSSQRKAEELVAYEQVTSFRDPAQNLLYDGDGTRLCHWCSLKGFPPNAVIYTPYQSMDTCNQLLKDSFNCHSSVVLFRAIFGLPQLGQEQNGGDECVLESSLECN